MKYFVAGGVYTSDRPLPFLLVRPSVWTSCLLSVLTVGAACISGVGSSRDVTAAGLLLLLVTVAFVGSVKVHQL